MKKYIFLIGSLCFLYSCSFLESDVYDDLMEGNVYKNAKSCKAGLAGIYDPLTSTALYGENIWGKLDSGTDLLVERMPYNISSIAINLNNYDNTHITLKETWGKLYEGINRANTYIAAMEANPADNCGGEREKIRMIAEAKGLRALYYLNLVNMWGEVPLRIEATRDLTKQQMKKSPQEVIYAQIISDLEAAEVGCYKADELDGPGHISQTAAQALLARAYMWMSGYPLYADKWDKALEYALKVKDSQKHKLRPKDDVSAFDGSPINGYRNIFIMLCADKYDLDYRESMFEVEFWGNDLNTTRESGALGLTIGVSQSEARDPNFGFCYGFYGGTKLLYRLYEDQDERKWWNFADYGFTSTVIDENTAKVTVKPLDEKQLADFRDGPAAKWRREYEVVYPKTRYSTPINFSVMRYSDVLLMIAECDNEVNQGPTTVAMDALNEVRARAGASVAPKMNYTDFRNYIMDERARELCYEATRRADLRRWGKDVFFSKIRQLSNTAILTGNEMIGYGPSDVKARPALNLLEKHIYFPIPESELSVNVICGQNEGW